MKPYFKVMHAPPRVFVIYTKVYICDTPCMFMVSPLRDHAHCLQTCE